MPSERRNSDEAASSGSRLKFESILRGLVRSVIGRNRNEIPHRCDITVNRTRRVKTSPAEESGLKFCRQTFDGPQLIRRAGGELILVVPLLQSLDAVRIERFPGVVH